MGLFEEPTYGYPCPKLESHVYSGYGAERYRSLLGIIDNMEMDPAGGSALPCIVSKRECSLRCTLFVYITVIELDLALWTYLIYSLFCDQRRALL